MLKLLTLTCRKRTGDVDLNDVIDNERHTCSKSLTSLSRCIAIIFVCVRILPLYVKCEVQLNY